VVAANQSPPVPMSFLIVVFAVAIIVAGVVTYLGVTGTLGGPIP
jgi:hypothetical protein